jgi:hypothetical protein
MASVPRTTNQGTPFPREPFVFPSFGNIGPPYIATLSLPRFTIGLPVWFFSTPVIPNVPGASYAIPPPKNINLMLTLFLLHLSGLLPFLLPRLVKDIDASNQVDKKKKKRKIKKKKNKQGAKLPTTAGHVGGNQPVTVNHAGSVDDIDKPTKTTRKPKFPCRICKGDHLLKDFPGLPKILEVWSMGSQQPVSPAASSHAGDNPSTSDSKVGSKKGRVKFPCRLCEGSHQTYLFPRMDEASHLLEEIVVSQQQLPTGYHKISTNQPLVDKVVDLIPSSVDPTLPLESEVQVVDLVPSSVVDPTLSPLESEVQVVDLVPSSVDPTLPLKSEVDTCSGSSCHYR